MAFMFARTGRWKPAGLALAAAWLVVAASLVGLSAQSYDGIQRARARSMLEQLRDALKKTYYDPTFHGLDIDQHFRAAGEKLEQASSYNQALAVIAQSLMDLNDSHTFFDPPSRTTAVDYGFRQKMVGDTCLVTAVRPGSDAEAKGLKAGDTLLAVEEYSPTRANMWKLDYIFYILNRIASIRVLAKSPGGEPRALDIGARIRPFPRKVDVTTPEGISNVLAELDNGPVMHRFREKNGVVIWKMSAFDLMPFEIDDMMDRKVGNARALILDLRGNGGGFVDTLQCLVSHFFDREVRIADLKGRAKMKPQVAKKRRDKPFKGRLIVLVDSQSASAAEMFARVMQIEKRGSVIGDRSEGAVMQAETFVGKMSAGSDSMIVFSASIANADVIMSDGRSLEHVGVVPDELLLPTAADLAAGVDPVMVRAAQLAGERLSPEVSGLLFPIEWRK